MVLLYVVEKDVAKKVQSLEYRVPQNPGGVKSEISFSAKNKDDFELVPLQIGVAVYEINQELEKF